jgi:hypothetical protein
VFGTLELPGVGLAADGPGWRALVKLIPGVDFVTLNGRFHDPSVSFDAVGEGRAFSLRLEARGCATRVLPWVSLCAAGGPTLLEGETFFNGGFLTAGVMF